MSIEVVMTRLADALETNTSILERVLVGQEAALAKLDQQAGAKTSTRTPRAAKTEEPAAAAATPPAQVEEKKVHPLLAAPNGETKKNAKNENEPTGNFRAADFSREQVKNEFIGWLASTTDANVRKERAAFIGAIAAEFGVKLPFHPTEGLATDDDRKRALFYLRREREGLKVDFKTDYDFDGDPLVDQTTQDAEPAEEDLLG